MEKLKSMARIIKNKLLIEKLAINNQLSEEELDILKNYRKQYPIENNPPTWVASEKIWDEAKKQVRKEWDKYDEPWSVVSDLYFKMKGKKKKI